MTWLLTGATGSLGLAFQAVLTERAIAHRTAARSGADLALDIADLPRLEAALTNPDLTGIINCAAMVELGMCEANPQAAHAVNARPLAAMAAWSQATQKPLVQISTDQFFHGSPPRTAHDEHAPITLNNEYARTKFAGEAYALTSPHALVVRTNMAAAKPGRGKVSIAAWALDVFTHKKPLTLFNDYFCSAIDSLSLATAVLDLVEQRATGLINVASCEVFTKEDLIRALAAAAGISLDWAQTGSAAGIHPPRATNVGLNVEKAQVLLSRRLPNLSEVARTLVEEYRKDLL